MPTAEFFQRFGILTVRNFLDARICAALRKEMRAAPASPALVYRAGVDTLDESVRSVKIAQVSSKAMTDVHERLSQIVPTVEQHFGDKLDGFQSVQFLVYREGAHYNPHRDSNQDPKAHSDFHRRAVAAVVFLNGESPTPKRGCYTGGGLAFYGVLNEPPWDEVGFPLAGEPGLLVCFRANTIHEVRAVTGGERFTVVTWFNGQPAALPNEAPKPKRARKRPAKPADVLTQPPARLARPRRTAPVSADG
jgi:SM-20-related protein